MGGARNALSPRCPAKPSLCCKEFWKAGGHTWPQASFLYACAPKPPGWWVLSRIPSHWYQMRTQCPRGMCAHSRAIKTLEKYNYLRNNKSGQHM